MMPGVHGTASLEIVISVSLMVLVFHRKQNVDGMVCHLEGYETIFYDDKCYVWFGQEKWNRSYSKYFCSQRGLELPRIDDVQATVKALISQVYFKMTFRANASLWLGATHHEGSKQFRWDDNNEFVTLDVLSREQRRNTSGNCVVLTSALLVQTKQCSGLAHTMCMGIAPRYFGKDKSLKCNCMGAICSLDGDCFKDGGHCKPGWFGKMCQKRDLLFGVENPLTDFDDRTCVPNTTSPQTFNIYPPNCLLWLRIVLKNKGQLDGFQVDVVSSDAATGNVGRKEIVITDKVVDIWCGMNVTHVTRIILRWETKKTICSVHVFGGLNVALKETSSQSSTHQKHGPGNAVDGEYGLLSPSATTRMEDPVQKWTLEMSPPKIVLEVVVYLKSPQAEHMMDVNLTLQFESPTSNRIGHNNDHHQFMFTSGETGVSIQSGTLEAVNRVKIGRREDEGNLDLSEVEVYGDCAPPYFGLLCEKKCNNNCKDRSCHVNGECYKCVPGTSGSFCHTTTTHFESAGTSPGNGPREVTTVGGTPPGNGPREASTVGLKSAELLDTTGNSKIKLLKPDDVTPGMILSRNSGGRDSNTSYFTLFFALVLALTVVGVTWKVINQKKDTVEEAAITPDTTEEETTEEEEEEEEEESTNDETSSELSGS